MNNSSIRNILLATSLIAMPFFGFGQVKGQYSVYKLANKIGTEVFSKVEIGDLKTLQIITQTNDRGTKMTLKVSIAEKISLAEKVQEQITYTSAGNTSRFQTERIDTTFNAGKSFSISDNGSIKLKELLLDYWNKTGRPPVVKNTLNDKNMSIQVLDSLNLPSTNELVYAIELSNIAEVNEIIWINKDGKAIFLATCDTEGDKRELIDDGYLKSFDFFMNASNEMLLRTYQKKNQDVGRYHQNIAVIGGQIIDVVNDGKLISNSMILLENGKIKYIGAIDKSMIPAGAHLVEAEGKYIMPGLWDMHAHLFHPEYLKKALQSGITTVRDMANEFEFINTLKKYSENPAFLSPSILRAGVLEGKSPFSLGAVQVSTSSEIETMVKKYHDAGFNQIKIYSKIRKGDVPKIYEQAKRYDMEMVGHLPDGMMLKYVIENGMKIVSHVHYFMNALKWNGTDLKNDNAALIEFFKSKGLVIDPTLNVYAFAAPQKMGNYKMLTKLFADQGIPIVAGTDNGDIAAELSLYVDAGFSTLEAIRSATIVPAKVMKMEGVSGSIELGKQGDLILLDANPLENISNIKKISTLIRSGLVVDLKKNSL